MNGPDKVRQALAMQDAGYHAKLDYRDVGALLHAYDKAIKALTKIAAIEDKMYGPDWEEIEEARDLARTALAVERDLTKEASNG